MQPAILKFSEFLSELGEETVFEMDEEQRMEEYSKYLSEKKATKTKSKQPPAEVLSDYIENSVRFWRLLFAEGIIVNLNLET